MINLSGKSGKAATRGQKQIYEENQTVILYYSVAAVFSSVFYILISLFFSLRTAWEWLGFSICCVLQIASILTMRSMARCRRNEKGQVTDAGLDLNQPDAFGEYCKDVIILCSFVATIATIWSKILWLLLLIPAYVLYKLWKVIIAPWFFAEPLEQEEEKKMKKRERRLRKT
uniref:Transmembrane protein 208 n=1 Tax=Onchocerca volvulus TaxID=6282 RepID=A0A8R1TP16_ONCVO